ncbi:iron chelate uptake ABC transporter family permease subunit [Lihuaxuella thermophila]|uniref:Manganese transport system membrane protein MntC n=1 Tax=Lihuaxuella thermophila TaxID=1173111 RepID=A0A1H8FV67_9BACL|nr:iron chelate uptake ABC transporter family permease subunit [Lihuaxuella thermophila]SEN34988.1 manganese/zinc/iron transport system permease protein [Lihuaxuella thermophila]
MAIFQLVRSFFDDPNALWVISGTTLLGLCSGVLGCFAFLRKRGLMGDVLAHSTLPGICLAFMITGSKHPFFFLIGATLTGIAASLCIGWITRYSRIKEDTALGLVLSVFFGVGIVLLTQIQHSDNGNQSGLDKFLFGQSASMVASDVQVMGTVAVILLILCFLFFKELKLLCFDANFGRSLGFPMRGLDFMLMLFLVVAVVIGLQAAGVVLMAALLITPAAAARYWTERLEHMVLISAAMGAFSGILGTWISSVAYHLSTGPIIVISATSVFMLSMIFAPQRGLLAKWIRLMKIRKQVARENLFAWIYESCEGEGNESVSIHRLNHHPSLKKHKQMLHQLEKEGYLQLETGEDGKPSVIRLTEKGWETAYETVLYKRMLEVWLMHEGDLESDVHSEAITSKEQIPDRLIPELRQLLVRHGHEPKRYQVRSTPLKEGVPS